MLFRKKSDNHVQIHQGIAENKRLVQEVIWGQKFYFAIQDSQWLHRTNFNASGWALGFPALYLLYRVLNVVKPKSIIEFGLGESTKMTFQYIGSFPDARLQVIEQSQEWLDFIDNEIPDIAMHVKILPIETRIIEGYETIIYSNLLENISGRKYDLVLIDGPVGSPNFSRSQLIDIIENDLLEKDFVILLDDCNRIGERQTASRCLDLLKRKGIANSIGFYRGMKTMLIICSDKYKYLQNF